MHSSAALGLVSVLYSHVHSIRAPSPPQPALGVGRLRHRNCPGGTSVPVASGEPQGQRSLGRGCGDPSTQQGAPRHLEQGLLCPWEAKGRGKEGLSNPRPWLARATCWLGSPSGFCPKAPRPFPDLAQPRRPRKFQELCQIHTDYLGLTG